MCCCSIVIASWILLLFLSHFVFQRLLLLLSSSHDLQKISNHRQTKTLISSQLLLFQSAVTENQTLYTNWNLIEESHFLPLFPLLQLYLPTSRTLHKWNPAAWSDDIRYGEMKSGAEDALWSEMIPAWMFTCNIQSDHLLLLSIFRSLSIYTVNHRSYNTSESSCFSWFLTVTQI